MNEQNYAAQKVKLSTWKTILGCTGNHMKFFALILGSGMALGLMQLFASFLNMYLIDHFLQTRNLKGFPPIAVLVVLVQLSYAFLAYGFCYGAGRLEGHLSADLRLYAFEKLQTMSFSYFDKMSVGYLLSRLTSDISRTVETISWNCIDVGFGLMSILASLIGMFAVNPKLALIIIAIVPPLALVSVFFQKRILKHHRETRRLNSMMTSGFNEGITGAVTTKTLVREELNLQEFTDTTGKLQAANFRAASVSALYLPIASLIISFATAGVLYAGGSDKMGCSPSVHTELLYEYRQYALQPIRNFAAVFADLQSCQAAAERVADVLTAQPDIQDTPEVIQKYGTLLDPRRQNWEPIAGAVDFDHVTFRYAQETVLEDFSLHVNPGETIALVGETGSGKSTIVNLLCRFYHCRAISLLIDGKDVRQRSQLWLQSSLGYVLQAPHLFSGTIRDNIRYGKLDASEAEIRHAAAMVGADAFIQKLDQGYDTEVGEGGSLLSTGQKQLISFARAILADPRIFVLDEATSSIDTESEMQIQSAIETLLSSRTSFVVAHRLSTIRNADRILVIHKGKILEQGTHTQLMAQRGRYYQLYLGTNLQENIEESIQAI